ncbi:proline-rich receptor-like protein kinase PERK2 [Iris pallida]|uniref:Proline-rich receptor-like protein kinase PERK2 n=1 Tax=Iris pallida TaxID=29817 RepID=A0AAX6G9T2_IRIPA|nr:proline-rich receptor-like protein kinase PERK2 [Iris pallida]
MCTCGKLPTLAGQRRRKSTTEKVQAALASARPRHEGEGEVVWFDCPRVMATLIDDMQRGWLWCYWAVEKSSGGGSGGGDEEDEADEGLRR